MWAVRHPASGYVQGINDLATVLIQVFAEDGGFARSTPVADGAVAVVAAPVVASVTPIASIDFSSFSGEQLLVLEADVFWCLSKVLDGILDHYTFAQPGIQRMQFTISQYVKHCNPGVIQHLEQHQIRLNDFAYRWINCYLMREISTPLIIRMWDSYLSEPNTSDGFGFGALHAYVCAELVLRWAPQIVKMDYEHTIMFLQHLPTGSSVSSSHRSAAIRI